ncbi:unnamed protein product [Polarella glacialis]|uniref:Acyltransferase 3 domain-containing protein n=1 Tax=Polarella glacialis TaxID=89957 RepID=A0A813H6V0_POLGL|nr:unnamed protein product [Polarella glacialis]
MWAPSASWSIVLLLLLPSAHAQGCPTSSTGAQSLVQTKKLTSLTSADDSRANISIPEVLGPWTTAQALEASGSWAALAGMDLCWLQNFTTSTTFTLCVMLLGVAMFATACCGLAWSSAKSPETRGADDAQDPPGAICKGKSPPLANVPARLDALDGLRVLFTMQIILGHRSYLGAILPWWFGSADAVTYFFMLSGFIQTLSDSRKKVLYGPRDALAFMARRLGRLGPAYQAALLLDVAWWTGDHPVVVGLLTSLGLQSFFPIRSCGLHGFLSWQANSPAWFVSSLLIPSLCHPWIYRKLPRGGIMKLSCVLAILVVCDVGINYYDILGLSTSYWFSIFNFGPACCLTYLVGMMAAKLAVQLCEATESVVSIRGWMFDASFLLTVGLAVATHRVQTFPGDPGSGKHGLVCVIGFCWVLISATLVASRPARVSPLGGMLGASPLVAAADYCYGAYIYQNIFSIFDPMPKESLARFVLGVCCPWLVAILSKHLLEDPLNARLGKLMRQWTQER